jgi:lipoyl(octanoyl) transferase
MSPACYRAAMDGAATKAFAAPASEHVPDPAAPLVVHWLGRVPYRDAWDLQKRLAAARASGAIGDQLLLLEHPAVLTLGRQAEESHVLAPAPLLESRGIELLRVERGGEVTYHGPGQLVAYPILHLADRGLLLRSYVRALEAALIATCAASGVTAGRRDGHPGCWVDPEGPRPRKIGALGIRVERGVAYHGIALNVDVSLADFDLIDPCGMPGLASSSIAAELGHRDEAPSTERVAEAASVFAPALARALGEAALDGALPPFADPASGRAGLERLLAVPVA